MSQVDVILHYRYGGEMREGVIKNISRVTAERFINGIGNLRKTDGILTIGGPNGIQAMVPARGVDLAEVRER